MIRQKRQLISGSVYTTGADPQPTGTKALKDAQLEMREAVKTKLDGNDLPYSYDWGALVLVGR